MNAKQTLDWGMNLGNVCEGVIRLPSIAHDIHCPDINATDQGGINLIQEARSGVYTWS